MTNKKRKVEFEVEAIKFVGFNDGKRLFRVWWRGHQLTDVIPEDNFNDAMMHILRIVEERGSAKKTKRYVLTGAASTVPSSEDVERASVDDAVVRQNQFRSVDSNCTLFAVLNMVPMNNDGRWVNAVMPYFPPMQSLRLFCVPAHKHLGINLVQVFHSIEYLASENATTIDNHRYFVLEQGTHSVGIDAARKLVYDCALLYPYKLSSNNLLLLSNIDAARSFHMRAVVNNPHLKKTHRLICA